MADITAVKEITDRLENGVKDLFESDKYAAYLKTMSRFHRYSTRNTLLIHLQMPDATRVAGYTDWKNKFGRQVKKGEHGIKILAPAPFITSKETEKIDPETQQPVIGEDGAPVRERIEIKTARFKAVSVFDVSQTDGEPLPELAETLNGDVERYELFMDALKAVSPLPITFEDLPPDTDGTCSFGEGISIRSGMSEVQTVSAVIHEITHAKLHDIKLLQDGEKPKDRRTEEVEAESVSYAVSQYYGIETSANSFGYLAEWSKGRDLKELNASLDTIRVTSAALIDGIDAKYSALAKERGIDLTVDVTAKPQETPIPDSTLAEPVALPPESSANQVYAKYANIVAERAAQFAVSSGTLHYTDEAAARRACDQIVHRVVNDMLLEAGEHYPLFTNYMDSPDFKARLEDYAFIKAYLEQKAAAQKTPRVDENIPAPNATSSVKIPDYSAFIFNGLPISDKNPAVGATVLIPPVFIDGNFNRDGKRIRVTVEEPAGKYQLFSREEFDKKALYFLTASGMIDRTAEYFSDEWNDVSLKWENHCPIETEMDEVIGLVAERFEKDMADPVKWAKYQHAAVMNRIAECEAHNEPVRELREEERKAREAETELERQEEKRVKAEKYDARIAEVAAAISSGISIKVGYDENAFDGKNPVLDLFKLHGIDLPLRTQGWVNTGLAEITDGSYRYYKSKNKGDSTAFSGYLKQLREAIRLVPIEQKQQQVLDMSLPDPLISGADRNAYGYTCDNMLPISSARAVELFDTGHCIFLLYADSTEAMAFGRDEIRNHDGLCGIEREDWERSPVYAAQMAAATDIKSNRESDLLFGEKSKFGIYQIPDGIDEARDFRFISMRELEALGLTADRANYELVYTGDLAIRDTMTNLHKIFADFQAESQGQPSDYLSRSVSASDVIVLQWRGNVSSHYVDSFGFVELPSFTGSEIALETAMTEAERFGRDQIVDITVSSPPNPDLAKLEADVKAGKAISLMDLSRAVNSESRRPVSKGKPSLLARLEDAKIQVEQNKNAAIAAGRKERGYE